MPPLDFNDRINLASMVGTWLGSAFTGLGLIAVYSQLQRALKSPAVVQRRMLKRGAGDWSCCIDEKVILPEPEEYCIDVTLYDRGTAGTLCWSRLFAQCGIKALDLVAHGGPDARVLPIGGFRANRNIFQPQKPSLADVRVDDGKLLYGFSAEEFTALLILGGFSPAALSLPGRRSATSFLGCMHVMDHSPFTQVAVFDPHHGISPVAVEQERYLHTVPVAHCLELALGLIRTAPRGSRTAILLSNSAEPSQFFPPPSALWIWQQDPDAEQLKATGDGLQKLTGVFDIATFAYLTIKKGDLEYESAFVEKISGRYPKIVKRTVWRASLLIAHAIDALQPWPLLPVTQQCLRDAMVNILQPFIMPSTHPVEFLRTRLAGLRTAKLPSGWSSVEELIASLELIRDIRTVAFQGSAIWAANYYCAMKVVFEANKTELMHVRRCLAAEAASQALRAEGWNVPSLSDVFISELCVHDGQLPSEVCCPEWALHIYATFLWAWFKDAIITDLVLADRFQRRIFLG
ncbi:MAG: hypothetical protein M1830_004545 [Pleopsidium flavum]|nr:MAG: hypothetical protein M1830_004545 [Pleopsidium flavum]